MRSLSLKSKKLSNSHLFTRHSKPLIPFYWNKAYPKRQSNGSYYHAPYKKAT